MRSACQLAQNYCTDHRAISTVDSWCMWSYMWAFDISTVCSDLYRLKTVCPEVIADLFQFSWYLWPTDPSLHADSCPMPNLIEVKLTPSMWTLTTQPVMELSELMKLPIHAGPMTFYSRKYGSIPAQRCRLINGKVPDMMRRDTV